MPAKSAAAKIREKRFIAHYSVHFNGAAAVRFAGYETKFAAQYALDLLAKPHVQTAVTKAIGDLGELHFQLANENIAALKLMRDALADPMRMFDAAGDVLDPQEWPEDLRACVVGLETEQRFDGKGEDAVPIKVTKVKFERRATVIAALAKVSGHIVDRTQFVDKDGNPTNPPSVAAPIISITVGQIAVPAPEVDAHQPKRGKK